MRLPQELARATMRPVELTVAELLELFGERNRDPEIVGRIEGMLAEAGLCCVPTLIHGHLDSPVTVRAVDTDDTTAADESAVGTEEETFAPASLRIADLPTARLPEGALVCLSPDDDLPRARMVMLENYFSQLPVMAGPYVLKGVVTWQSIALAHARGKCESLADATVHAHVVDVHADLLVTLPEINQHDCVFVRDEAQRITGLVTAADLSMAFGSLTGPFLRLGEIERRLRTCVKRMCATVEELRAASGNNRAESPDDLTVWQIQQVFAKPDRWALLNWGLPQDDFVRRLDAVRKIRNEVAHFRPDPLTDDQLNQVTVFAGLVKNLVP
ncbi:CBS domain-containing protein [Spirillospora sp. NPDC052242]